MLRSIARSALLKRSIATQAAPKAEITELSNGLVVATEPNSNAGSASVGIVFGSGAAAENPYNNGVSHVLSSAFKSANGAAAAKEGFSLSAAVDRDFQSYIVDTEAANAGRALDFLQSKLFAPVSDGVFSSVRDATVKRVAAFEEQEHAERVLEHLHATAFQNTPLSLPKRGTVESLETLEKSDVESFAKSHFVASNAVIVGSGNISHEALVKAVESQLSLAAGSKPVSKKVSSFLGSEIRLRDDTLPKAWISIAAEGEPITSPNYYVAKVAAQIFGSYVASEPASNLQGVKLLDTVKEYHLADSFNHFSLSYKDAGLWGFSTEISNIHQIDDLMHFALKEWNRLSVSITETEVARGKALLKLNLATAASSNAAVATALGAQTLATGSKLALSEVFAKIDAITAKDVKKWANERLWDQDIAIAGTGQIEGLLDYMRMRNDMSMMRW
ncbi:AaceriABR146Wp [[Ashbya] aceris (nom. inval.)]|nr:AaceriABR146Wp [[Ashbya] aceris (nom. inval.)]